LESPDEGSKLARIVGKTSCSMVVRGFGLKENRPAVFIEGNTGLKCTDEKSPTRTERRADGGRIIGEYGDDGVWDRGRWNNRYFGHMCFRFLPGQEDCMISTRETPYLDETRMDDRANRGEQRKDCPQGQLNPPPPVCTRLLATPPR